MTEQSTASDFYTLAETIWELYGWAKLGKSMFPINVAFAAVHWLENAPVAAHKGDHEPSFADTRVLLRKWLDDETPEMPDAVGEAALYWLRRSAWEQNISVCSTCGQEGHHGCAPAISEERQHKIREFDRWERSLGRGTS